MNLSMSVSRSEKHASQNLVALSLLSLSLSVKTVLCYGFQYGWRLEDMPAITVCTDSKLQPPLHGNEHLYEHEPMRPSCSQTDLWKRT